MEDKNIALYAQKLVVLQNGTKIQRKIVHLLFKACYDYFIFLTCFKKNKTHQTQNFLFSFFLLFLLTTFEFVISERPVKMSDQPKVCLDLNGHLG